MEISKRVKIVISVIIVLIIFGGGIGYGLYRKEQKRELTLKETVGIQPFSFSDFHNTEVKMDGTVTLTFEIDEFLNKNKRQKMDYYIYDSQARELVKLALNEQDSCDYTINFKDIAERKIQQFIREGENGQFLAESDRMEQLLNNVYENHKIYLLATPKGYVEKEEKRLDKISSSLDKEKLSKENSFNAIDMNNHLNILNDGLKPEGIGYSTYTEYVVSLVTEELSNEDFIKLVTAVQVNVPKQIEILKSHLFEGQYSEILKEGYFARGNFDYRRLGYVLAEDYGIGTYSPITSYLRTYSVSESEEKALKEDIAEWNQRIIEDTKKYEEPIDATTLEKSIMKAGLIDNALFSYKNTQALGERLEITEDREE